MLQTKLPCGIATKDDNGSEIYFICEESPNRALGLRLFLNEVEMKILPSATLSPLCFSSLGWIITASPGQDRQPKKRTRPSTNSGTCTLYNAPRCVGGISCDEFGIVLDIRRTLLNGTLKKKSEDASYNYTTIPYALPYGDGILNNYGYGSLLYVYLYGGLQSVRESNYVMIRSPKYVGAPVPSAQRTYA